MTRPCLRPDLVLVEQRYRGEQSYIAKDPETHKYFRFRLLEVLVMQQFDGARTPAEVTAALTEQGLPFSTAAVEGFARKIGQMGLLVRSLAERSVLLMERLRAERLRRLKRTHYTGSVLRMRWSVADPNRMFDTWTPRLRFFFSRTFLTISVVLFLIYFVIFFANWGELSHAIGALTRPSTYTLQLFLELYITALVIIAVHELGHGFTCKHFGGQVHEMGAMLIYFQPAFYCNVNDAWTFPELRARLWVTAAGSWIQLVLAAIGAIVWWMATPGTFVSRIALDAIVVGGVTTILANANPLIQLDGYYALSDYLEIPNLRQRALQYIHWLVKRKLLRLEVPQPAADDREKKVFLVYGPLAVLYSVGLLLLIAGALFGWVSRSLGAIGILAFAFALWAMLRGTLREWARAVATSIREHRSLWRSRRLWQWTGGAVLAVTVLGLAVPWPITVTGTFTAATPLRMTLKAPEGAVVARVYATEGTRVPAGAPVVALRNLALERQTLVSQRLSDSLAGLVTQTRARGRTAEVRRLEAERTQEEAQAVGIRARLQALTLRAPVAGVVLTPRLDETLGRWFSSGEVVVTLGEPDSVELRVRLERAGATLVKSGQPAALIHYADPGEPIRARVMSVATAAGAQGSKDRLEARVRVASNGSALRPGVTGEAKIAVRRSNVFGALWWAVRKRVRSDLLL